MRTRSTAPMLIHEKGIIFSLTVGKENEEIIKEAKKNGLKYRTVGVINPVLRNYTDLHGKPYKPSIFIYVEQIERKYNNSNLKKG